jgi:hypothetical protein
MPHELSPSEPKTYNGFTPLFVKRHFIASKHGENYHFDIMSVLATHGVVYEFESGYTTSVPSIKNSGAVPTYIIIITLLLFETQIAPLKTFELLGVALNQLLL